MIVRIKMKTIIIDLDDCIANGSERCTREYNKLLPNHLPKITVDTIEYDFYNKLGIKFREFFTEEHFLELNPIENSVETLQNLSKDYRIMYITARGFLSNGYEVSKQWLTMHSFPFKTTDGLFVVDTELKSSIVNRYNLGEVEFVLDDAISNITDYRNNIKTNHIFMIDRPWNRDNREFDQYRIKNIIEVLAKLGYNNHETS